MRLAVLQSERLWDYRIMGLFKKSITFQKLCTFALIDWDDGFYKDKEALTESAHNESEGYRLTPSQIDKLWTRLEYFYLLELYLYSNAYFQGKHEPREISKTIYTVYLSYLVHQKGIEQDVALEMIGKQTPKYVDEVLEEVMSKAEVRGVADLKGSNLKEVLNIASEKFCTDFNFYDVSHGEKDESQATDQYRNGMFDSERVAFKLIRPTVPVLEKLFRENKIVWK